MAMGKANFPKNQSKLHSVVYSAKDILRRNKIRPMNIKLNKIQADINEIIKRRKKKGGKAKKWHKLRQYVMTLTTRMK